MFAVARCGGGSESAGPTEEGPTVSSGGGGDAQNSRCRLVPKDLIAALEDGLRKKGKETGIRPTGIVRQLAAAVRSEDFEKVFYVSAIIKGPDQIGTWATNSSRLARD